MRPFTTLAAIFLTMLPSMAMAQQFSANIVATRPNSGQADQSAAIFVENGMIRFEPLGAPGGHVGIIVDTEKGTSTVLMLDKKMYMENPSMGGTIPRLLSPEDVENPCPIWEKIAKGGHDPDDQITSCKRVGTETVGGRSAIKFEAESAKHGKRLVWIDPKIRFIIKTRDDSGSGMELDNIKEGALPDSLFTIPSDFQKFDMSKLMDEARHPPSGALQPPAGSTLPPAQPMH